MKSTSKTFTPYSLGLFNEHVVQVVEAVGFSQGGQGMSSLVEYKTEGNF